MHGLYSSRQSIYQLLLGALQPLPCSTLRRLAHVLATVSLLAISACVVVPVRVPTQERDVSGKPLNLDLTFLKAGATTRDELTKKLAAVNSN
jgi:hypothetical protein